MGFWDDVWSGFTGTLTSPTFWGGVGLTAAGIFTADPILAGIGATSMISGAVGGVTSGIASNRAADAAALSAEDAKAKLAEQKRLEGLAADAEKHHQAVLNDAKNGAYGPDMSAKVNAFSRLIASGQTMKSAMNGAGLMKGWGDAQSMVLSRQLNKQYGAMNGGLTPSQSVKLGDPLHRSFALRARSNRNLSGFLNSDADSTSHQIAILNSMGDKASAAGNSGGNQSIFNRVSSGAVQTTDAGSILYSTSS